MNSAVTHSSMDEYGHIYASILIPGQELRQYMGTLQDLQELHDAEEHDFILKIMKDEYTPQEEQAEEIALQFLADVISQYSKN